MRELERALVSDSAAASPGHILEGLTDELANSQVAGAPHTIYSELWHVTFWQQITLDWIQDRETPVPQRASGGFPSSADRATEAWVALYARFFDGLTAAAAAAADEADLDRLIRCPSPEGKPVRIMSVREQLESLVAHNAYHFGRIVLLRQMLASWPPPSGGYTW